MRQIVTSGRKRQRLLQAGGVRRQGGGAHKMRPRHACPPPPRPLRRSSLHWLLWLALVLPLAQSAAAWHALSHVRAPVAAGDEDQPATHAAAQCDLCLAAGALAGGAPAAAAPGLPASSAVEARPTWAAGPARHGPVALAAAAAAPRPCL
ncbi:MAG: hypothetical protein U1F53_03485 [Burkholderiaceae bacterium]